MKFPEGVERELLRALGTYLRAAPVSELPPSIRRFRKFRLAALRPHRDRLLEAVGEDDDLRAAILEWLEESRPRLTEEEERVLRVVAERAEGWEEQLARPVASTPESSPTEPAPEGARSAASDHDHKAEARRLRAELRAKAREHASNAAELTRQIAELRSRGEAAEGGARDAAAAAQAAKQSHEKELRRLQRVADKGSKERDRALAEVKTLRRDVKREARRADAAEKAQAAARDARVEKNAGGQDGAEAGKKQGAGRARPRRPLSAPPGLLEDDPATLAHWLDQPGVRLLVDGYNVAKQEGAFKALSTEDQRARTLDEIDRLVRRHGVPTTVVFDGAEVAPGTSRGRRGLAKVEFSRPPESGDDHLVALLASWPRDPVVVATSDKGLQKLCRALGSTIATSEQLLAALR